MKDMALIWGYFVWGGGVGRSNSYYGLKPIHVVAIFA